MTIYHKIITNLLDDRRIC